MSFAKRSKITVATEVGLARRIKNSAFRSVMCLTVVVLASIAFAPQVRADSSEAVSASRTDAGRLSAGRAFTCVVIEGSVYCWGDNSSSQLGDGTTTNRSTMVKVAGVSNVASISAGDSHICALITGGTVTCWGSNVSGELGVSSGSGPATVTGLTDATSVTAGKNFSCAISTSQGVVCWGKNSGGQLGRGATTPTSDSSPATVTGLTAGVASQVAAGLSHSCAVIASGGGVKCWGTAESDTPGVAIDDRSTQDIAYGISGTNVSGLGDGRVFYYGSEPVEISTTPVTVKTNSSTSLESVVGISVGVGSACGIVSSGAAYCWGNNNDGRVGNNRITNNRTGYGGARPLYAEIVQDASANALFGVKAISINGKHGCAVTATAGVACWGSRTYGELGDTFSGVNAVPYYTSVSGVANAVAVSAGELHTCALTSTSAVYCWGQGTFSQLGNGTTPSATGTPVVVSGFATQTVTFGALANKSLGDAPFSVSATSSVAGASMSYASSTTSVCTVSGSTVTVVSSGTCSIVATAGGYGLYLSASATQSFTVAGVKPVATTSSATSVAATNAVLNASVNPNGAETTVSFVLGSNATLTGTTTTVESKVLTGTEATEVSQKTGELLEANTYYFQVVAKNVHGTTKGEIRSFTTGRPVGVSINDADEFTNKKNVTVFITGLATSVKAIISNDGGFKVSQTVDLTDSFAEVKWTLVSSRDERLPKTVYVRFISRFNAQSSNYTDDIILDTTAPVLSDATAVTAAAPASAVSVASARVAKKNGARIVVRASDANSGIGSVEMRSGASKKATSVKYANPKAKSQTLTVNTKAKTLQVRVIDRAGNPSPWKTVKVK
jgi:alpha-tubulin suppressor-like RCC1 family protein